MAEHAAATRAEIMKLARELGMALARSQEMIEYREAERKVAKDDEACRLTRIFKETQKALTKLQAQSDSTESEIAEISAKLVNADRNMKQHPLIAEYYRAGDAFHTLIYQINQLIKFYCMDAEEDLQFRQDSSRCKGCGGCGSK